MGVLIPLVIVAFIAFAIYSAMQSAKERQEREEWARSRGMSYERGNDHDFKDRYPCFDCLRQGEGNRYAYNIVRGVMGSRNAVLFDYHYETYSTDSKGNRTTSNHYFSGVIIESTLPLRPLSIRPEGLFDKVTAFFGHEDINFESAEFSKKFYVTAPDKKWAYDVLHIRTMEMLLQSPMYTIHFDRDLVIAYRGSRLKISEFENASQVVQGILDALPEYVVKQQQAMSGL